MLLKQIDIWGIGCVLFEIITKEPLFQGDDEMDQINKIHEVLGTPPPEVLEYYQQLATHMDLQIQEIEGCGLESRMPDGDPDALDLISKMLEYEPQSRITAGEALHHQYFDDVRDKELIRERSFLGYFYY